MKHIALLLAAVLPLLLTACAESAPLPDPKEITLEAQDILFSDVTIEVGVGQPVRLILKNTGALEHDFNIEQIIVTRVTVESSAHGHEAAEGVTLHAAAAPGGTAILEFTPLEAGTFEFFCSTAGHKAAGMIGALIVKGP